jgi:hypothetical protein
MRRPKPSYTRHNRGVVAPIATAIAERIGGGASALAGVVPPLEPVVPEVIDLVAKLGQSNMTGQGIAAEAPDASAVALFYGTGGISTYVEPEGEANTGSMCPAFSVEWNARTGRKVVWVEAAQSGTPLLPDAVGTNWSPSGTLRAQAVERINNAIAAINESPYYTLGNVDILWAQGENDANNYNGTTISRAAYTPALSDLADYMKAEVPELRTFGVILLGGNCTAGGGVEAMEASHINYELIRKAQVDAEASNPLIKVLYPGAYSGVALAEYSDGIHWKQAMLNKAGECAAMQLDDPQPYAAITPFLGSTNYSDSTTTAKGSRSANHTTTVGTTLVVVAVSNSRIANAASFSSSVTFGGVAMKKCAFAQSSSATPAGRAGASMFYIDVATYGGSLSGITASIVVTTSNNSNIISWCAIDAKDVELAAHEGGQFPAGTTSDTGTAVMYTYCPTLIVTCGSAIADSAAARTATFTGATELMDSGLSNGTRAGMIAVGYSVEAAAVDRTISIQWSSTLTQCAVCSVAFRRKVAGE